MRRLTIATLLFLTSCATPVARHPLRSVPAGLGEVAWTISPADVVAQPHNGTAVVWVGQIAEFTYAEREGKLVLEWVCDYLPFVAPGKDAIRERPLAVKGATKERFLINLVEVDMPEDSAEALKRQYARAPYYVLVAGTVDSVVDRGGSPTVFLYTHEFELSPDLVSHAQ